MRTLEHNHAVQFMQWWALSCKRYGVDERLLFAIPNGGKRHIAVARKMKAEGVRAGVSDYFLAVPRNGFHGLFIELKAGDGLGIKKGQLSEAQIQFGQMVREQGYDFTVARGFGNAMGSVQMYLRFDHVMCLTRPVPIVGVTVEP